MQSDKNDQSDKSDQPIIKSTFKRDILIQNEQAVQAQWKNAHLFETNAMPGKPKFMATFPYPYMNGTLHLGHAFTITKADFMNRYKQLQGFNTSFPMAFHATGMPIVTCAAKVEKALSEIEDIESCDFDKMPKENQLKILYNMGVPKEELHKFVNPKHWVVYFSLHAKQDLQSFGVSADFTKSFVTTDLNPHYDQFIKWQFNKFKQKGMLKFGKKHVVYSRKDGQPCAAHDRSEGEEVGIKEFAVIYFDCGPDKEPYKLLVATTRAETFYKVANLWVNPTGEYKVFVCGKSTTKYICSQWMLDNLKHQNYEFEIVGSISGQRLLQIGSAKKPDMFCCGNVNSAIPIHPCTECAMDKGSGIVGSVPSHSVFDFVGLMKLHKSWVKDANVAYNTNDYSKDRANLTNAITVEKNPNYLIDFMRSEFLRNKQTTDPDEIYKKDLSQIDQGALEKKLYRLEKTKGFMNVGNYVGKISTKAKALLEKDIETLKVGFKHYEPDDVVISRSGDRCIVALTDQWFIDYGQMTSPVKEYFENSCKFYESDVKEAMRGVVDWLSLWPCSRSYGLGTQLLDTEYMIDSLSDSTIYMAYYTIARDIAKLPIVIVNDKLFDYIFENGKMPKAIQESYYRTLVESMKQDFEYWYPFDLRVSGKDLIGNHLTMCLFAHQAVLPKYMPGGFYVNGHVMLNKMPMSKGKGNFMTLKSAILKYGADASRLALAVSSVGGISDANFTDMNANSAVLKLSNEREWFVDMFKQIGNPEPTTDYNLWDQIFNNAMNTHIAKCTEHYESMDYQMVVTDGFYGMLTIRDQYRAMYENKHIDMNLQLMHKFIECTLAMFFPICPHWVTYLWNLAGDCGVKLNQTFPTAGHINPTVVFEKEIIESTVASIRSMHTSLLKRQRKNPKVCDPDNLNLQIIFYHPLAPKEQKIVGLYREMLGGEPIERTAIVRRIVMGAPNKEKGNYGKFVKYIEHNVDKFGPDWLNWATNDFDFANIVSWVPKLVAACKIKSVDIQIEPSTDKTVFKFNAQKPHIKLV